MSKATTTSNEEATTTIVDAQQPGTKTQQAEIDYQQQGFNLALVDYDRERCVYQEIEERARVSPSKAAIAYRGRELSYHGLNAQANRVARYLVRMGVGKGDLVGVLM
ncbi:MAG: AMP-binding protein, partial [Candidatus Sulfotelmatobacter sp.]